MLSPEVRERAVKMVQAQRGGVVVGSHRAIASRVCCVPQTLDEGAGRAEVDAGAYEGRMTSEAQPMTQLEVEADEAWLPDTIPSDPTGVYTLVTSWL